MSRSLAVQREPAQREPKEDPSMKKTRALAAGAVLALALGAAACGDDDDDDGGDGTEAPADVTTADLGTETTG
jgi:hypothetical protein